MLKGAFVLVMVVGALYLYFASGQQYSIDKPSPKGTYRIKIEITPGNLALPFQQPDQHCKIQYFKGQQEIHTFETRCRQDEYEFSLADGWQVVEWLAENAARIGTNRSDQPFADELTISNKTGEVLKNLGIGYGRFQEVVVFDIANETTIKVPVSPEFKPDGTSSYEVVYSGTTQSGARIQGDLKQKQRSSPADGPLRFEIAIDSKSVR